MKKTIAVIIAAILALAVFAGCTPAAPAPTTNNSENSTTEAPKASFDTTKSISVISREDGSGTRGAFIELMGIQQKDADGNKQDLTTQEAVIASKTDVMLASVAGNEYAIGYVSLGSLNDKIKALKIEGVEATAENIKNNTYKVARPFNIATKGEATGVTADFISFILSAEGQKVVANGYIAVDESAPAYAGTKPEGKIVIVGSSSVSPIMEKLVEAYKAINTNATIEIQTLDSTAGMKAAIDGTCDIGMASRELKETELAELTPTTIAIDGIAVIVNNANPIEELSVEQVMKVYTGAVTKWNELA